MTAASCVDLHFATHVLKFMDMIADITALIIDLYQCRLSSSSL